MKERPILFSAPMILAILNATKTQTRRVIKPQPDRIHEGEPYWHVGGYRVWEHRPTTGLLRKGGKPLPCPYGRVGDRLWVKETWAPVRDGSFLYRADPMYDSMTAADFGFPWNPSIHMPKRASRITLEITGVKVERLQEISEADAKAEGSFLGRCQCQAMQSRRTSPIDAAFRQTGCHIHGTEFRHLWETINGPGSWDANPWVWAITFQRVKGGAS